MTEMTRGLPVVLIGGSSHSGKSALAESLAHKLGWKLIRTDGLARHPGRPWRVGDSVIRPHVAEHYLTLSVGELIEDVLRHYRSMWSEIEELIRSHATDPQAECLVMEGSALWPESVVTGLQIEGVAATWLTAPDDLFEDRIHTSSGYDGLEGDERTLVEKFLARTIVYNERMMEAVTRLGLVSVDVDAVSGPDALVDTCLGLMKETR